MITATDDGPEYTEGPVSEGQFQYVEALIQSSCLDLIQQASFTRGLADMDLSNVQEIIDYLLSNQLNPVTHRGNHSATEANRYLRKICKDEN